MGFGKLILCDLAIYIFRRLNLYIKPTVICVVLLTINGCASYGVFNIPSVEGVVVDSKTKLPLKGVVVVAERRIKGGYHVGTIGYLPYLQALTNKNGQYVLPSLGVVTVDGYIDTSAPVLYLFKSGYKKLIISNDSDSHRVTMKDARSEFNRISIWNKKMIEMKKFDDTKEKYNEMIFELARYFNNRYYANSKRSDNELRKCNWVGMDLSLWYEMLNRNMKKSTDDTYIGRFIVKAFEENKTCSRWDYFFKVFSK